MNAVLFAALIGIALLGALVLTKGKLWGKKSSKKNDPLLDVISCLFGGGENKALDGLVRLLERDVNNPQHYFLLGAVLHYTGAYEQASRVLQNLLYSPSLPSHLRNDVMKFLGDSLVKIGHYEQAQAVLEPLVSHHKNDRIIATTLSTAYEKTGDLAKAFAILDRLPSSSEVNERRASLKREQAVRAIDKGDLGDAHKHLQAAVSFAPEHAEAQQLFISVLAKEGKFQKLQEHAAKVLEHTPEVLGAIYPALENACYESGDIYQLEKILKNAILERPSDKFVYLYLAKFVYKQKHVREALFQLRLALDLDPRFLDGWFELFRILLNENDLDTLKGELQRFINPEQSGPLLSVMPLPQ